MQEHPPAAVLTEIIQEKIYLIRGQKVMLSHHLAALYEVEPRALVQAIKRNAERFPDDFMFQLSEEEFRHLRSQTVILKKGRGRHPKYPPYAFTEQGVAMLSAVVNSNLAVRVSVEIIRVFVKLRQMLVPHQQLAERLDALESKYDGQFQVVFKAIRGLMTSDALPPKRRIGFSAENEET